MQLSAKALDYISSTEGRNKKMVMYVVQCEGSGISPQWQQQQQQQVWKKSWCLD